MLWLFPGRALKRLLASSLVALFILGSGCGSPPQVGAENRELIVSLATAISSRNTKWLESNVQLLEKRRAEGKCSDAEYQTFKEIIGKAKSGDWKAAEEGVYALREAQEPTAQDLENLAQRKLGKDHGIPKTLFKASRRSR